MVPGDAENILLKAKIETLLHAATYPEPTRRVESVETHMSWVFLTDRFAYKLKKPVRLAFLDFSTIEQHRHFCIEEVRLNQRLAPRIYIGVVPLTVAMGGALSLGGKGTVADWLVKMHRIPATGMLDHAIRRGTVRDQDLQVFADRLVAFYRAAPAIDMMAREYRLRFEAAVRENWQALAHGRDLLPPAQVERVHGRQLAFLESSPWLLEERALARRIVEAHGDLRPEHVFLGADPQVIDCLEFHAAFRALDPVDELAFFGMECEVLGAGAIGRLVLGHYCRDLEDDPPPPLLDFYRCYRACIKAKLAYWHLRNPEVRDKARWPDVAKRYLGFAERYGQSLPS
jgi:aminoglycoside phosphotransferase family enzyme